MVQHRGTNRGSYIGGNSVHNTRIERMWVDVNNSFAEKWAEFFHSLECNHGLNPLNQDHIWLIQWLFLDDINDDAVSFQNSWNYHTLSLDGRNQRPAELFLAGCLQHGARGLDQDPQIHSRPPLDTTSPHLPSQALPRDPLHLPNFGFLPLSASSPAVGDPIPSRLNTIDATPPRQPFHSDDIAMLERTLTDEGHFAQADHTSLTGRWQRSYELCITFTPLAE
ncbi:hypothetical protein CALCODRAFT_429931 [Calocera cornea HHB12733]|uniref:Integrase core domain-containing protein n=1 Tax=Calocera cornea HHB12733 TaxID=1353952 RepID=A0A165I3B5_9BASI|nr:hypothetical protein CALCODRAFT_429931 [Calocera cornea HHB12733]